MDGINQGIGLAIIAFILGGIVAAAAFGLGGYWRVGILAYLAGFLTMAAIGMWYGARANRRKEEGP